MFRIKWTWDNSHWLFAKRGTRFMEYNTLKQAQVWCRKNRSILPKKIIIYSIKTKEQFPYRLVISIWERDKVQEAKRIIQLDEVMRIGERMSYDEARQFLESVGEL